MSTTRKASSGIVCRFNDCDNAAVHGTDKCAFHKNRRQCIVDACTNQVYARKLCVRHGGKKQCQAEGCDSHARGGGYCLQHGGFAVKRFCVVEGCHKQAHARQKCVRHGGGRRCRVSECAQHARAGGLCNRHSHGHVCCMEGCTKIAQHLGSICFHHAMELRAAGKFTPEANKIKYDDTKAIKTKSAQSRRKIHCENEYPTENVTRSSIDTSANTVEVPKNAGRKMLPSVQFITNGSSSNSALDPPYTHPSRALYIGQHLHQPTLLNHTHQTYPNRSGDLHESSESELEYILNSYSRLISPTIVSTDPNASMSFAESVHQCNKRFQSGISWSSDSNIALHRPFENNHLPPSLVRLNSLLPPPPGVITGKIPRLFQLRGDSHNASPTQLSSISPLRSDWKSCIVSGSQDTQELVARG